MKIRDVMNYECVVIGGDASLRQAAQKMDDYDVGVLPVCEAGKLVGVITDRDIVIRAVAQGRDPSAVTVRETMTTDFASCREDEEAALAAQIMEDRQIRRLPILDQHGRLAGIVSLRDLQVCQVIV